MKNYKQWREENINEFFGVFKKKEESPKDSWGMTPVPDNEKEAFCPFCKSYSAVLVADDATGRKMWHCKKCHREWNEKDGQQGMGMIDKTARWQYSLHPDQVAGFGSPSNLNYKECLYLSGLITEEQMQQVDINQIASQMQFQPTSKKKLTYQYAQDYNNMSPMSYTVAQQQTPIVTITADGKETQNVAEPNDLILSGPSGEKYVVKAAKFPKLYVGQIGGPIHPEQGPRNVAVYNGSDPVNFIAPWGESMVLKPGDYLVKEAEGKFYRIAKKEYEATYNQPGKVG
jgi:hypothetical protein